MASPDRVCAGSDDGSGSWSKELALLRHEVGQVEVPHPIPPLQQRVKREEVLGVVVADVGEWPVLAVLNGAAAMVIATCTYE